MALSSRGKQYSRLGFRVKAIRENSLSVQIFSARSGVVPSSSEASEELKLADCDS